MTKREPDEPVFGDLGESELKPVINKDIPLECNVFNWQFISQTNANGIQNLKLAPFTKHQYGDVFEYTFPTCEVGPLCDGKIKTARIYDVDIEEQVKLPHPNKIQMFKGNKSDHRNSIKYTKDAQETRYDSVWREGQVPVGSQSSEWFEEMLDNGGFCIFVMSKDRQKVFGDFIQKYTNTEGPRIGTLCNLTPWLFDRFCFEVKPMYAKFFFLENTLHPTIHQMDLDILPYPFGTQTGVPEQGQQRKLEWRTRVFHREMDFADITLTDTNCQQLLMGSLSGRYSINIMQHMRLRVYYGIEEIDPQHLLIEKTKCGEKIAQKLTGARYEYSRPDWTDLDRIPGFNVGELASHGDHILRGVSTVQKGDLKLINGGMLNQLNAKTNVLQDTAGELFRGWY